MPQLEHLETLEKRPWSAADDWSLTPGHYVGVSPEDEDEGFDSAQIMREIHTELDALNAKAATLATTIRKNFEALVI